MYNLIAGGTCIEDIADLQTSQPVRRILGADRIPDPTTAGDFLRRFDANALGALDRVIDQAQEKVWKRRYGKKKAARAIVDLDSCVRPVYGERELRRAPSRSGRRKLVKGRRPLPSRRPSLSGQCLVILRRPPR